MKIDLDRLNRAAAVLADVATALPFMRYITPSNAASARASFIASYRSGQRSNPVLEYPRLPAGIDQVLDRAEPLSPTAEPWRELYIGEVATIRQGHAALRSRAPMDLTNYSLDQHGSPNNSVVGAARDYLQGTRSTHAIIDDPRWSAESAAALLAGVLEQVELPDWKAEVSTHMASRMSVLGSKRRIRVRKDATFLATELRRLIVHEIVTHAFRQANSQRQPLRWLAHGIIGYLPTEEGLAVWNEEHCKLRDVRVMRRYALRYIAAQAALEGDFCAVMDELTPHTSLDEAFDITLRVKRGLVDTSDPGGYLKDQVYFGGYKQLAAHLTKRQQDYELLMATKWPVTRLDILRELEGEGLVYEPKYRVDTALRLATELAPDEPE